MGCEVKGFCLRDNLKILMLSVGFVDTQALLKQGV
jgi:hypothetical protein